MIKFPETAQREWSIVADTAKATLRMRKRLERDTLIERELEKMRIRHEAQQQFQAELDADDTPALEMYDMEEYENMPDLTPKDLIFGAVRDKGLTVVVGPSQSGKTTIAIQMLHSLMTGTPWLGQKAEKLDGGVGLLSYDVDASQTIDWMMGMPGIEKKRVVAVNAYAHGNPLGVPAWRSQMAERLRANNTDVILIDSFSASFFGGDQNDAAATMSYYRDVKKFAFSEVGVRLLIVIAHSTAASPKKVRGSSVHFDTADNQILVCPTEDGHRVLSVEKYRERRGADDKMQSVILTSPDINTHLVNINVGQMAMNQMKLPASVAADQQFPDPHEAAEIDVDVEEEDDEDVAV